MNFKMYNANYFFGVFQELLEVKTATKPVNWGFLRTPTSILNHVRHLCVKGISVPVWDADCRLSMRHEKWYDVDIEKVA